MKGVRGWLRYADLFRAYVVPPREGSMEHHINMAKSFLQEAAPELRRFVAWDRASHSPQNESLPYLSN